MKQDFRMDILYICDLYRRFENETDPARKAQKFEYLKAGALWFCEKCNKHFHKEKKAHEWITWLIENGYAEFETKEKGVSKK